LHEKISSTPLLDFKHVTKVFSSGRLFERTEITAVDDVSFQIPSEKATIITLAGESGSGKTTIARMVLDLIKPTSGEIRYRGKNLQKMSRREKKNYRKEVQAVFQDPYGTYNPFYKVDHVFTVPLQNFNLSSKEDATRLIDEALESVGLRPEQVLGKFPHQLSGGERQRLMIARCLLTKPKILVADEPVSMLDASLRASILDIFLDLKANYDVSVLFITHDLSVAYYLSDKIIILDEGRIVESGTPDAIIKRPAHPYVQLLISSIPVPNPEKKWTGKFDFQIADLEKRATRRTGCIFYDRCKKRLEKCARETPQMTIIEPGHQVACHLYS